MTDYYDNIILDSEVNSTFFGKGEDVCSTYLCEQYTDLNLAVDFGPN